MNKKLFCLAIVLLVVCIPLVARLVYAGGPPGPSEEPPGFENGNQSEKAEEAIDVHRPITPGGYYERLVLVHHAKGGIPGPPDKEDPEEPPEEPPKDNDAYELLGLSWPADVLPVDYFIDPDHAPEGSVLEIADAFEAWDAVTSTELFDPPGVDTTANPSVDAPDYDNTVSWRRVVPPRVIAVTFIWYDPGTGEMVDCDVVMNTNKKDWGIGIEDAFDVCNIVTHEAGHVVGLADLYDDIYSELTMYGYSSEGETKKISLENGDKLGAQELYGAPQ